jgi:hypothetical protein
MTEFQGYRTSQAHDESGIMSPEPKFCIIGAGESIVSKRARM